jgi:Tfp pilus assembly protein PilO
MNKMRQWSILTAVGTLAVFAAGWLLLVSPQRSHAADLRTQAGNQQQANASLQAQVNQLQQQKHDLPAQQRLLDQIAAKIPSSPALPVLIRQLTSAADDAGVDLVSLSPGVPVAVAAAAPTSVPPAGAAAAAAAPLNQIPLTIQVQGSYFNVESFFREVEHLSRAMLVQEFTLSPVGGSGPTTTSTSAGASASGTAGSVPPGTLNGQISASVFESPTVTAPQATTAAPVAPAK